MENAYAIYAIRKKMSECRCGSRAETMLFNEYLTAGKELVTSLRARYKIFTR